MLEKVRLNQITVAKEKKDKMDQLIKRSLKKEKYAEKFNKSVKYDNNEKKEKKDERRSIAMNKVRQDQIQHTNKGMEYYKNVLKDIDERKEQVNEKERAKSAQVYSNIRYNAEIYQNGGNISQMNKHMKNVMSPKIESPPKSKSIAQKKDEPAGADFNTFNLTAGLNTS